MLNLKQKKNKSKWLEEENLKAILETYELKTDGIVYSKKTGRPQHQVSNYVTIRVMVNGVERNLSIDRLEFRQFLRNNMNGEM